MSAETSPHDLGLAKCYNVFHNGLLKAGLGLVLDAGEIFMPLRFALLALPK